MRLTALPSEFGIRIVRDGDFRNLGFLGDTQPSKLIFLEREHLLGSLRQDPEVSCVITSAKLASKVGSIEGVAESTNPRLSFSLIHNFLAGQTDFYGSPQGTKIDPKATIHSRATVAERNVVIGANCYVEANVWIGEGVQLGAGVTVQAGSVLGGTGFQVMLKKDTSLDLVHAGRVMIEDAVVVMANSVVARALFRESTTIGSHSRIGNLAFISHNVRIGTRTIVGHHAVINGNVVIGRDSWIGPNATISNNLKLGEQVKVSLGATVIRDIPDGQRVTGPVAVEHRRMMRHMATYCGPGPR